jgi:hypothetical protein
MSELLGRERLERLRRDCPYFDFLVLAVAPRKILTEARGCREEVADTSYYLYLDESSTPLVAGRTFSIHPEQVGPAFIVSRNRLRGLTDRERPRLLSRYGPSAPCPLGSSYRPYDGWMERWDGEDFGSYSLAAMTNSLEASRSKFTRASELRSMGGSAY